MCWQQCASLRLNIGVSSSIKHLQIFSNLHCLHLYLVQLVFFFPALLVHCCTSWHVSATNCRLVSFQYNRLYQAYVSLPWVVPHPLQFKSHLLPLCFTCSSSCLCFINCMCYTFALPSCAVCRTVNHVSNVLMCERASAARGDPLMKTLLHSTITGQKAHRACVTCFCGKLMIQSKPKEFVLCGASMWTVHFLENHSLLCNIGHVHEDEMNVAVFIYYNQIVDICQFVFLRH